MSKHGSKQIGVWGRYEIAGPKHDYRERSLLKLIRCFSEARDTLLDVGCGSGSLLFRMANAGHTVHGIDVSNTFVDSIQDSVMQSGLDSQINVKVGNAENLDFEDSSVDGVVLAEVLEHLPNEKATLSEVKRVLKPNGLLYITVPANPALWTTVDEEAGHFRRYTAQGLASVLEDNGFGVTHIRWWGFPITRIYEKIIFRPWAKNRSKKGESPGAGGFLGKLAKHPLIRVPGVWLMSIDELFHRIPMGIGLMAVARNIPAENESSKV